MLLPKMSYLIFIPPDRSAMEAFRLQSVLVKIRVLITGKKVGHN